MLLIKLFNIFFGKIIRISIYTAMKKIGLANRFDLTDPGGKQHLI
ncbi:MAG: hypothetical protein ACTS78_01010 [Arsenophonus sp. NC-WZS1-MAG3]